MSKQGKEGLFTGPEFSEARVFQPIKTWGIEFDNFHL